MEEFVTFEIGKKLKEKGFPQGKKNTLAMYNEEGEWFSLARYLDDDEYCFDDFDEHDCVAPTISQVLKWLREEKKLHIMIDICFNDTTYKWGYDIVNLITTHVEGCEPLCANSFEEAALAGIEYVLDLI